MSVLRNALPLLLVASCVSRPINPWKMEGWPGSKPGAEVEGEGLFDLRHGRTWPFTDRVDKARPELTLSLEKTGDGRYVLRGRRGGDVEITKDDGFLVLQRGFSVVDKPLKFSGRVGQGWNAAGAKCYFFGYDRVSVADEKVRALVVAVDRRTQGGRVRDLYWFAKDYGWVRIRNERNGGLIHDAFLTSFEPGASED
jgi:hypothetical protein